MALVSAGQLQGTCPAKAMHELTWSGIQNEYVTEGVFTRVTNLTFTLFIVQCVCICHLQSEDSV